MRIHATILAGTLLLCGATYPAAAVTIKSVPGQAENGCVEIHGLAAGEFNLSTWQSGTLNFVADVRTPLIVPRLSGVFRNIYAPSAVQVPDGWRLFYGAWDGVPTGNDRIYSLLTADFLDFGDRRTVIEHGDFTHVCNVSALKLPDGSFRMLATAYPDAKGLNKPAAFASPDGQVWNGRPEPYPATKADLIEMTGYPDYEQADINGMNVLFHEKDAFRIYFCNFKAMHHVYRASGKDGKTFQYEGTCLATGHMVNDVKAFDRDGRRTYLMGLHANTNRLWYALSNDGMRFEPERPLAENLGEIDKYIVAIGWVVKDQRLLGFLYGAGAVPELNRNRIFARWLQKKLVFTDTTGRRYEPGGALGPDRLIIPLQGKHEVEGRLEVFAEDGKTSLGEPVKVKLTSGSVYVLSESN